VLGWPLIGNGKSPFIGDVNRDNINEIVTSDAEASTYVYNSEGKAEYVEWQSYRANPENTGVYRKTLYEVPADGTITLNDQQKIEVDSDQYIRLLENSKLILNSGSELKIKAGCTFKLYSGSELVIESGANLILEEGARVLITGNAKITGDIGQSYARIAVTSNSQLTLGAGSSFNVKKLSVSTLILGLNSKIIVDTDSYLNFDDGALTELNAGAEIVVRNGGHLVTRNLTNDMVYFRAIIGKWKGITCEVGGIINIDGANLSGVETGILGTPTSCTIKKSSIYNCSKGIELINCSNYNIEKNTITGNNSGVAIRLATSNGTVRDNTLRNFSHGLVMILCSPIVTKNLIRDNVMNGIYINGNNAYPYLVDDLEDRIIANNEVVANGINTNDERNAQIRLVYPSNAYMYYGMNNIYYHDNSPAIYAQSNMIVNDQLKSLTTPYVKINAQYNYWGASVINSDNTDDIFNLWMPNLQEGYRISYADYVAQSFPDDGLPIHTLYADMTLEAKMLAQAIEAENDGKIDLAIKKYEKLIEKYPDSEENYIAVTRLTDILAAQEVPLDQLMSLYEENIISGDETVNKRFYREMKVIASIKSKKYDAAVLLAEELKTQALNDNDVLLADLDIAIAGMMKEAENNNKGNSFTNFSVITSLTNKISEDGEKAQPADIVEGNIPKENKLYQNYPNPFNPVTQIRFALSKTANVKLSVYNIAGQQVTELANGIKNAGFHTVSFDGSRFNSGVYYYMLEADGKTLTQKMILMK
ncbi:MAG: T9SS type A sorting domain-containing protein, partial [Candidatus Delongbacteria bacterium]|nr:T9SS type A sorting domain-containing protein [Candidatus Delongbacteria bacterium]